MTSPTNFIIVYMLWTLMLVFLFIWTFKILLMRIQFRAKVEWVNFLKIRALIPLDSFALSLDNHFSKLIIQRI